MAVLALIIGIAYGIPASVTSFAEGETSKPSDKFVGGIGTAKQTSMWVHARRRDQPHHYTFVLIATDLDPKALPPGLTKLELLRQAQRACQGLDRHHRAIQESDLN